MKQIIRPCIEAQLQLENRKMRMDCVQHRICPNCGENMYTQFLGPDREAPCCKECDLCFDEFARSFRPTK